MKGRIVRALLLLLVLLPALGCQGMYEKRRQEDLYYTALNYARALRWGDLPGALALTRFREGRGEMKPVDLTALSDLKVTHYEVGGIRYSPDGREGQTVLELEYYFERNGRVHRLVVPQTWWFDEKQERWYCACEFPGFRP